MRIRQETYIYYVLFRYVQFNNSFFFFKKTQIYNGVYDEIKTTDIDDLLAKTIASKNIIHYDYATLAARIAISNLHKETPKKFSDAVHELFIGERESKISYELYDLVKVNCDRLDAAIVDKRDYGYSYFGYKTLERSYLLRINGKIVERPQYMLMRVALGIHDNDIDSAIGTYDLMSQRYFTHASPTLFNAGTPRPQMSSCFLLQFIDPNTTKGIYDTISQCAQISSKAGGIGINFSKVPAENESGSGGIISLAQVLNNTARHASQGNGKRPGAFAVYLEPWHCEIFSFLELKKNTGAEELRARDLFYGLWIPDLFMKRVEDDDMWSLFCPSEAPDLDSVWGSDFEKLYTSYEQQGIARKTIKARNIWEKIVESQIETGTPYMLYKDSCNKKSNQQNLGPMSSNLCTEIIQYSSPNEVAVCNLASIALPAFVNNRKTFNYKELHRITKIVTRNLDKIIDGNYYPVNEAQNSNIRHRPIGIGVQGLADVFMSLRIAFDSDEAAKINRLIFETIYHAALESSCELAKELDIYDSYDGSPVSHGILQYDMWNVKPSKLWDWDNLKNEIANHGVRNSLLVAPMPTASTSQILNYNECFEPYTSNLYARQTLAGTFQVVNPWLIDDLIKLGLWNDVTKQQIMANNGSVQKIDGIPDNLKAIYKTVWEISQKVIINMAAERGAFIDQSQSLNIFIAEPTYAKITSMHFYGWKKGLKTGMYYLRTKAAVNPIMVSVKDFL